MQKEQKVMSWADIHHKNHFSNHPIQPYQRGSDQLLDNTKKRGVQKMETQSVSSPCDPSTKNLPSKRPSPTELDPSLQPLGHAKKRKIEKVDDAQNFHTLFVKAKAESLLKSGKKFVADSLGSVSDADALILLQGAVNAFSNGVLIKEADREIKNRLTIQLKATLKRIKQLRKNFPKPSHVLKEDKKKEPSKMNIAALLN
jgi:hypothetical protein